MLYSFFDYIISNYLDEDTNKGDLAKDMKKVLGYFSKRHVLFWDFESTLEECWEEFQKSETARKLLSDEEE